MTKPPSDKRSSSDDAPLSDKSNPATQRLHPSGSGAVTGVNRLIQPNLMNWRTAIKSWSAAALVFNMT
jgi:hypothetical protein